MKKKRDGDWGKTNRDRGERQRRGKKMRKQSLPDEIPCRIAFSSLDRGCRTVRTRRRWLAVNRIIRITADAFFSISPITLKTMLHREHARERERGCNSSRARWKPVNYIFTPFDEAFPPPPTRPLCLSPSVCPADHDPVGQPAEK